MDSKLSSRTEVLGCQGCRARLYPLLQGTGDSDGLYLLSLSGHHGNKGNPSREELQGLRASQGCPSQSTLLLHHLLWHPVRPQHAQFGKWVHICLDASLPPSGPPASFAFFFCERSYFMVTNACSGNPCLEFQPFCFLACVFGYE